MHGFQQVCEFPELHAMFCVHFSARIRVLINKHAEMKPLLPAILSVCFTSRHEPVCLVLSLPCHPPLLQSTPMSPTSPPALLSPPFIFYTTASLIRAPFKKR